MTDTPLDALARSLTGPFAFCGIAIADNAGARFHLSTAPAVDMDTERMFRVASISKMITGMVCQSVMAQCGIPPPYAHDVSDVLGYPLNLSAPVTFGMLASHTAGLADLVVPADASLRDFLAATPQAFQSAPGTAFAYSNLGYVVLAAAMEKLTGERFDVLAKGVQDCLGIEGGFNWSGVVATDRLHALPTFRRDGDSFVAQIDAAVAPEGVMLADGTEAAMAQYRPGWNPALFAPHGGFRSNMKGLLTLANSLRTTMSGPIWKSTDGPGDYLEGLFQDYGCGMMILPDPPFYPRPLVGHFGNAYGFRGGVWLDRKTDTAFAYALNGAALGDESDILCPAEKQVFDAIAALKG